MIVALAAVYLVLLILVFGACFVGASIEDRWK